MLFEEIRARGYGGTYKGLHTLVSPWRVGNMEFEAAAAAASCRALTPIAVASTTSTPAVPAHPDNTARQVAPQIAAALLTKPRVELTVRQAAVVDALKIGCPGYTQMRSLMLAFRSILRTPARPTTASTPVRSTAALRSGWTTRTRVASNAFRPL